jgi:hypothetical protein
MTVKTELRDAGFESFEVKIGSAKVEFDGLEESTNKIKYSIPRLVIRNGYHANVGSSVRLIIYDILGREVITLVNKQQQPGNYEIEFNASNLPSGIYFYRLQSGSFAQTKKLMLLR